MGAVKLKYFADFIEKELGIVYSESNYFQLEQRLEKIAEHFKLSGVDEVYTKAKGEGLNGDFKQYILDISTNNESSFFRDPKVFKVIENVILPQLREKNPRAFLYRIWCAAASFGQEPYSVAMLVDEFLKKQPGHPRFEIVASDIADHALARCREAKYSQLEIQRGLPINRVVQYFNKLENNDWQIKPEIKNMVTFKKQNLLEPLIGFGTFNVILCRYVLIYQDAARKAQILERIEKCLAPGGILILGASESALGLSKSLTQQAVDGAIYYVKNG